MLDIGLFFFVWKENSRGDSDTYHRFLQFLILDLHKSEVSPSILIYIYIYFFPFFLFFSQIFFFKNEILLKNNSFLNFSGPFYPSTPAGCEFRIFFHWPG